MGILRSERFAALLLVLAAAAAASCWRTRLQYRRHRRSRASNSARSRSGTRVKDGLLAIFFFLAAIELKHELRHGELDSPRKALVPGIAALGGVVVPADPLSAGRADAGEWMADPDRDRHRVRARGALDLRQAAPWRASAPCCSRSR